MPFATLGDTTTSLPQLQVRRLFLCFMPPLSSSSSHRSKHTDRLNSNNLALCICVPPVPMSTFKRIPLLILSPRGFRHQSEQTTADNSNKFTTQPTPREFASKSHCRQSIDLSYRPVWFPFSQLLAGRQTVFGRYGDRNRPLPNVSCTFGRARWTLAQETSVYK